jgi:alpha-L-fucosidase
LIRKLVDIVSKGGNYLLNVGPTAEGVIPQPSVDRLLAMGEWLETNGEAVYGTEPGPVQGLEGYRSTAKGTKIYLHVLNWPEGGQIGIPNPGGVSGAYLLGDPAGTPLTVDGEGEGLVITGPANAPDEIDTVVVLTTASYRDDRGIEKSRSIS